jgi:SAM-dependent methyltransferase
VELHPLATKFASVADAYERGRPEHRPAVVGALAAELELGPGARVLDLAAGTGKLTRALVAGGLDVVAVEPQKQMREKLAAIVGGERVLEGVAESIPLPDDSVDAVTVADGFHWFDHAKALGEISRVLAPGGGLAVLSMFPDWSGASWAHELGTLIQDMRSEHPTFDGPSWQESVRAAGGWTEPRGIVVSTREPADAHRIVDYVASISFIAALPDDERIRFLERVDALVEARETPAELGVHVFIGLTCRG